MMELEYYMMGVTSDSVSIWCTEWKYKRLTDNEKLLIAEALRKINYQKYPLVYTVEFDRVIGSTLCVELDEYQKQRAFWVYRKRNPKWRVFAVIGAKTRKTVNLTVLFEEKDDKVVIADWYFGKRVYPLPSNPKARKRGKEYVDICQKFWQEHALVVEKEEINVEKTLKTMDESDKARFIEIMNAC